MKFLCFIFGHKWEMVSGSCLDGWIWVNDCCTHCSTYRNPLIAADVETHNRYGTERVK